MISENQCIRDFAVHILGCGCPDPVFESMEKTQFVTVIKDVYVSEEIIIGKQLLLYVTLVPEDGGLENLIAVLLKRGVVARNSNGYNRLRLVFYSENEMHGKEHYLSYFDSLAERDERTSCHFVKTDDVAEFVS